MKKLFYILTLFLMVSCNLPFGDSVNPTPKFSDANNLAAGSAAPIPGSYVNTFTKSIDGKTLTITIDQSTAKNISHTNFSLTACDGTAVTINNITGFTANGVDVMLSGKLGSTEGNGNSCYGLLPNPFIKLDIGFTTPLVTFVIDFDVPIMAGQILIKSATECWGLNDPKFMFTLPCAAKKVCYGDGETAWASGTRYVTRGNWATYTTYQNVATSVNLYAGQNKFAGTAAFSAPVAGKVTITITLNSEWTLQDVSNPIKVQNYSVAPTGNPSPGRFAFKGSSLVVVVPADKFYGVHLDVKPVVECPL